MTTVRCPNCDAAYNVDPAKLGEAGRKLKCAKCQAVWLATAEFVEEPAAVAEPVQPEAPVAGGDGHDDGVAPASDAEGDAAFSPESDEMLVQRNPGVDAVVRVGGWRQWVRGDNLWRSAAVGVVALGLLAGSCMIWMSLAGKGGEEPVVEHPLEAAADVALTADVVPPPEGIVLHRVRGDVSPVDGKDGGMALTVRGLLVNTTSSTITVPPMRLELLGKDGSVADMWPVSGIAARMDGGAEEAWTVSLTAPDMSTIAGWRVVFVSE